MKEKTRSVRDGACDRSVVERLHVLEDRDRHDAGLTRNVAANHQHHAELPQRVRETEHDGGDIAACRHRRGHGNEGVEGSGAQRRRRLDGPRPDSLERPLQRLNHERQGIDDGSDHQPREGEGKSRSGEREPGGPESRRGRHQYEEIEAEHGGR